MTKFIDSLTAPDQNLDVRMGILHEMMEENIQKAGFHIQGVFSNTGEPDFGYTIGLHRSLGYELICMGLPMQMSGFLFNVIYDTLKPDGKLKYGVDDDRWANMPTRFYEADDTLVEPHVTQFFLHAELYDTPVDGVKFVQMLFPDESGKFPVDVGYNHKKFPQLLLFK